MIFENSVYKASALPRRWDGLRKDLNQQALQTLSAVKMLWISLPKFTSEEKSGGYFIILFLFQTGM